MSSSATLGDELPGRPLNQTHREYLIGEGSSADFINARAEAGLLRSVEAGDTLPAGIDGYDWLKADNRTGILFGGEDAYGAVSWLFRPEVPAVRSSGRADKYVGELEAPGYTVLRKSASGPVLIVEGTKQGLAAASAMWGDAASTDELRDATIIGIQGCSGWSKGGQPDPGIVRLCRDRDVVVALDADAGANTMVYRAGIAIKMALVGVATEVKYLWLPGRGTEGLDDLLAKIAEGDRRKLLTAWYLARQPKPAAKQPSEKTGQGNADFEAWDPESGRLRVEEVADHLIGTSHYRLAKSGQLASYAHGRYVVEHHQLASDVLDLLGNTFGTTHLANIRSAVEARTFKLKRKLPEFPAEPYANFRNGLVDLRTLEFMPHTPDFLGTRQVPVDWDPDAPADRWVDWAIDRMGEIQLQSLEDVLSQILDASTPPSKAPELYGPTRTGKSTVGRIVAEIAGGQDFVSGVPIQKLAEPRYAAMLYGMVLNVCTDLPREALKDESGFLRMMGADPIMADEKYGRTFNFVNAALHLFATNTIVTISGDPAPYLDRIAPFALVKSYAGKADPAVETSVLEQLPGICVRLAKAWQARYLRSQERNEQAAAGVPEAERTPTWLPGHPAVVQRFADASDRVYRFLTTCCNEGVEKAPDIVPLGSVGDFPAGPCTKSQLHEAFTTWAESEGGMGMGMRAFTERLMSFPGVSEIRDPATKKRVVNIGIKPREDWIGGGSDLDLLPALFPDEYPVTAPAEGIVTVPPMTVPPATVVPPAPAPPIVPPAPAPTVQAVVERFDADQLTALRMLTAATYDALARVAVVVGAGMDPQAAVASAPVALLLTDLAQTVPMSAERLRALIRRLDPLLFRAGWVIRERRLAEPGVLNSVKRPEFGDRDFGVDRVAYSVVRGGAAINPHITSNTEDVA